MGVKTKPDMLSGETALLAEHECPLKADCRIQAGGCARVFAKASAHLTVGRYAPEKSLDMAEEMEAIVNFYCRARGTEYTSESGLCCISCSHCSPLLLTGLTELLAPFAALPMSRSDRYNCFYAFTTKFSLRDCSRARFALVAVLALNFVQCVLQCFPTAVALP